MSKTESPNTNGFAFQGYNVYQLPSASATITQAKKIAVYDIQDGVTRIVDQVFDPTTGVVTGKVVQLGTDSGIKRFLSVTGDAFNGNAPAHQRDQVLLCRHVVQLQSRPAGDSKQPGEPAPDHHRDPPQRQPGCAPEGGHGGYRHDSPCGGDRRRDGARADRRSLERHGRRLRDPGRRSRIP